MGLRYQGVMTQVGKRGIVEQLHVHRIGDTALVVTTASLTRADCGRLRAIVRDALASDVTAIVIDVAGVGTVDSHTAQFLGEMHNKALLHGRALRVAHAGVGVLGMLDRVTSPGGGSVARAVDARGAVPAPSRPPLSCCGATSPSRRDVIAGLLADAAVLPPGDPQRERLRVAAIEAALPAANRLAARYAGRGEHRDDLSQVAAIGLIKAIDGYDPSKPGGFWAYATPTIAGELRRHFRDKGWGVRVPRRLQDVWLQVRADADLLTQRLGRSVTTRDLAVALDVDESLVAEARLAARSYAPASLSAPNLDGAVLSDFVAVTEEGFEVVEVRQTVQHAMLKLPRRSRRILGLRYRHEMSQTQIAAAVGLSQMHVSRIIADSLETLRGALADER
jgi:RNA polymerase sigma-B factor